MLISIDSLRADHVGALGYQRDTTPTIDRLAAEGATFTRAISTTSWTLPAHAALLTGLPDSAHGATTVASRLTEGVTTLAEALAAAGYRTRGFFAGPFLEPGFGFAQGFDEYLDCTSYGTGRPDVPIGKRHSASHKDRTNPMVLRNVLHELEELDGRPFFFFVHMWDVHYDLIPPPPYDTMFFPDYSGSFDGRAFRHNPEFRPGMDADDLAHTIALYDGEVRYTDDTIGRIVDTLDAMGVLADTLIVITSDHGDEFLEHDGKGHRRSLFQEVVRVPLVMRLPGKIPARRVDDSVSLIDVAPTILDLVGAEPIDEAMGRSLLPLMAGDRSAEPVGALSELTSAPRIPSLSSLVVGDDKVIVDDSKGVATYFDLATDPGELRGAPAAGSGAGRKLVALLARRKAAAALRRAEIEGAGEQATDDPITPQLRSVLQSLGYLD